MKINIITKMHLVEVLLVFGVIAIPAGLVLRVLYARQILDWENSLAEAVGIPAVLYRPLGLGFFVFSSHVR